MIITTAAFKGGVGKTTTAIHVAAFLQRDGDTLLVDGDPNRSATRWSKRGPGFLFKVVSEQQAAKYGRSFKHIVIDTQARPEREDLQDLVDEKSVNQQKKGNEGRGRTVVGGHPSKREKQEVKRCPGVDPAMRRLSA